MNFQEYQEKAHEFAVYEDSAYPFLGLAEETGEFVGLAAKWARGDDLIERYGSSHEVETRFLKEAGDILWQLSECLTQMGLTLEDAAMMNIAKLTDRQNRNVIKGSGDDR